MTLDAIGIISGDIAQSQLFYGLLGVDLTIPCGEGHFEGVTSSGVRIMLDSQELTKKINPDWTPASGVGIVLAFKQNSPEEVDLIYNQIIAAGFSSIKEPWDAFWGQRYACVQDPDGNQVDLFAELKSE